jgi:thymidine phosphorylase
VRFLRNEDHEPRLRKLVVSLVAEMLVSVGLETDPDAAAIRATEALASGAAADVFGRMVSGLGGPADFVERFDDYLPAADVVRAVPPAQSGYIVRVDAAAVGNAVVDLGGGRRRLDDALDLSVGFSAVAGVGEFVDDERPLALVHAGSSEEADTAAERLRSACAIGDSAPSTPPVIVEALRPE